MARVSTKENKNIYQLTRESLKLTRESASELLETISPERIEKIENERTPALSGRGTDHGGEIPGSPTFATTTAANQCPIGSSMCRRFRSRTCPRLCWSCWLP